MTVEGAQPTSYKGTPDLGKAFVKRTGRGPAPRLKNQLCGDSP